MTNPSKMLRELRDALQNMLEAYGEEAGRTCVVQAREALALTDQAARAIPLAAAEPVAWSREVVICDDAGYAIGRDDPEVIWGANRPEDDPGEERWTPLYAAPDRAPSTDSATAPGCTTSRPAAGSESNQRVSAAQVAFDQQFTTTPAPGSDTGISASDSATERDAAQIEVYLKPGDNLPWEMTSSDHPNALRFVADRGAK